MDKKLPVWLCVFYSFFCPKGYSDFVSWDDDRMVAWLAGQSQLRSQPLPAPLIRRVMTVVSPFPSSSFLFFFFWHGDFNTLPLWIKSLRVLIPLDFFGLCPVQWPCRGVHPVTAPSSVRMDAAELSRVKSHSIHFPPLLFWMGKFWPFYVADHGLSHTSLPSILNQKYHGFISSLAICYVTHFHGICWSISHWKKQRSGRQEDGSNMEILLPTPTWIPPSFLRYQLIIFVLKLAKKTNVLIEDFREKGKKTKERICMVSVSVGFRSNGWRAGRVWLKVRILMV